MSFITNTGFIFKPTEVNITEVDVTTTLTGTVIEEDELTGEVEC